MEYSGNENQTKVSVAQTFSAIDIGTTKIVALSGYVNEKGEITVLGKGHAPSMGISRGEVVNLENSVKAIKLAVEKAKQEAGFFNTKVVVGIAGKHIHSTQNRWFINRDNPEIPITQDEVELLKKDNRHVNLDADEEIIHVIPQTFRIDNEHEVVDPIGMTGRRIEANFHIVIGKGTAIKYIRNAIQRAGLEVEELMLEPIASSLSTLTEEEKTIGVALIDIGGGTTDIAIYHNNIVQFTEVIPFGGNAISSDISEGCQILLSDAEQLKIEFGNTIQDYAKDNEIAIVPGINGRAPKEISLKNLSGIIQSRMEEIIDSALFVIKTSGYAKKLGAGIVVTGGGSLLENLPQLLSFKIGIESKIGTPINNVNYKKHTEFHNPIFATGVGLLMRASQLFLAEHGNSKPLEQKDSTPEATQQTNDVNQKEAPKQDQKEKTNFFVKYAVKFFNNESYADTKI